MTETSTRDRPRQWWRARWWELVPEAAAVVGLTSFAVTEPDAALSAFSSSKALALMAATGAIWMVARVVLHRFGTVRSMPWVLARTALFGAAAAVVLAVAVAPAYRDRTVIEALADLPSAVPDGSTPTGSATGEDAEPIAVASDELVGIDHRATGQVVIYRQPSGSLVAGLEDIDIQPGPDYDVYVVPRPGAQDIDGGVRLDDLRGNRGTQYHEIPDALGFDPGSWTVLVWCQIFAVPVAGATPT